MAQIPMQHQAPPVSDSNGVASAVNQFSPTSLYVGDLEPNLTDSQVYDFFNQVGPVVSVRVCRDLDSRKSLGYGYVNFNNFQDAARALDALNYTPLNGKPIRIMFSQRDPSVRKSGTANIFIKNLDKGIDHKALYDTFSVFGNILSCKIATESSGQSMGYGFVQFDNDEAAQIAITKLNGMLLNDKQVFVGPFLRRQQRGSVMNDAKFNNVFVKNLSESTTDADLREAFGEFGKLNSVVVMRDGEGKSKCFGFVHFENVDDAAKAVDALNGKNFNGREWYVGKAQKKSERELEKKKRFEQNIKETEDKYQGLNLYIKNLDDSISDETLKDLFSEFGSVASCKVMRDSNGISRGSGFVAFSASDEASRALTEMNGKMVASKPLYVAPAQRKEERRARLQVQFSQMRSPPLQSTVSPRMSMYPPGAAGLGQPLFYSPPIIPQGFGYQQQIVPGMRPGVAPMPPGYIFPIVQQGQQGPRPGGRRHIPPNQHQMPFMQQQPQHLQMQQPRGRGGYHRYMPGRNLQDVPKPGGSRPIMPATRMPITALATALANAMPHEQRTMLGENLYPLVDALEHEMAAKVTGMLLEMDQPEVLHLLESPDALNAKVAEAMDVLRNVAKTPPSDQLSALSLNDSSGAVNN